MSKKIKAILFDMDGVIVDSEPLHFEAHRKALEAFGIALSKEEYISYGVSGGRVLYQHMQEKYNQQLNLEKVRELKKKFYGEIIEREMNTIEGAKETLEKLRQKYVLALVSNTHMDYIHKTLKKVGVDDFFQAFSSCKELPREKPFPDVYLDSLKKLNLDPRECVAIEDSQNGVMAAKAAGLKCIAIPNNFTKNHDLSRADIMLSSIKEVSDEILEKLSV